MFKTRVLSAGVGLALLAAVMFLPKEVLVVSVFIVCLLSIQELYAALSRQGYKPVKTVGYLSSLIIIIAMLAEDSKFYFIALVFMFILALLLCSIMVLMHKTYKVVDISLTIFGVLYIAFMLSFVVLTRFMQDGFYFVWMIFIGAWVTDTFAYFTGKAMGRRKLIPLVSPNKTVEGSIAGIVGCTVVMLIYGVFLNRQINYISLHHYIILGLLCGIISQIGDLTASAIKRFVNIKDYGNIMPGHGGALDRIDSMIFLAPLVYFYISFLVK